MNSNVSPVEQRRLIKEILMRKKMSDDDLWFIVSSKWWRLWKDFVKYEEDDENISTAPEDQDKRRKRDDMDVEKIPNVVNPLDKIDNSDIILKEEPIELPSTPSAGPDSHSPQTNKQPFIKIRPGLDEEDDYFLIPYEAWDLLKQWYAGGPELSRKVIEEGESKRCRVEVYPLILKVVRTKENGLADPTTETEVIVSKNATITQFKTLAASALGITENSEKIRVWNMFGTGGKIIKEESHTLDKCMIVDGQRMLLEVMEKDGNWPREDEENVKKSSKEKEKKKKGLFGFLPFGGGNTKNSTEKYQNGNSTNGSSSNSNGSSNGHNHEENHNPNRGLCGLSNLGNTCFMNSALQCLSNTAPLTEYFTSGTYKSEINKSNPLGMKGKIAEEYGSLVKLMWSGSYSSVAPRDLKYTVGKFAPQFMGYSQHDSQELLAFLLDGLHEDLNRVKNKPYIEAKDNDGKPEDEAAMEAWENHLKRNQSIIVDLFQGQLKSTLVCPKCQHVSKCWDPFMYLSLPLPFDKERVIEVTLVRYAGEWQPPVKYALRVDKNNAKVSDLHTALAVHVPELSTTKCLTADVYNSRVYALLNETRAVSDIRMSDVTFIYEMPQSATLPDTNLIRVQVAWRRDKKGKFTSPSSTELFGIPFILYFEKEKTPGKELYRLLWNRVKDLLPDYSIDESSNGSSNGTKEKGMTPSGSTSSVGSAISTEKEENGEKSIKYPFKISIVSNTAMGCGWCSSVSCTGCEIPNSSDNIKLKQNGHTVTMDWDPKIVKKYFEKEQIPITIHTSVEENKKKKDLPPSMSLENCLNLFTTNEKLGANDPWYCPKCKEFQQAMKKFDLWKMPSILVVHLKRFQYSRSSREKINVLVDFPLEGLDLSSYVQGKQEIPPVYDLFAVSNHSGGLGGGHYTAYGKNQFDNQWYSFNDSTCSKASSSNIQSQSAYVLFYKRREPDKKN